MIFNFSNTRLVAVLSFVGVLLYYQHSQTPNTAAIVQIYEGGKLVNVSLSHEELENYYKSQQLQATQKHEYEMKAENRSFNYAPPFALSPPASAPPPPPLSPQNPADKLPDVDSQQKFVISESVVPPLPLLNPSNGSFLNTLDITSQSKEVTGHFITYSYTVKWLGLKR